MEAGKGSLVVMILVVMLMQGVAADYLDCLGSCIGNRWCGEIGHWSSEGCMVVCAARCTGLTPISASQNSDQIQDGAKVSTLKNACKLRCASSLCSNLNGLSNNDHDERCNRVCSKVCNNRVSYA